jgi:hypothetical protein
MTSTNVTNETAPGLLAPLAPRPDQREQWLAHRQPVDFEEAAQLVLEAHADDGERDDVVAHDLRAWAFGSSDGRTMQLAPVPLPGRPAAGPIALRELAFSQLAQRLGAPSPYLKTLPAKLQMACMNYGLTREKQGALLRLAGNEVRAIVSDRYAAIDDALLLDVVEETLDRAGYLPETQVRASAVGAQTLLRVTLPGESIAVRRDDVIEYGIDIGNSEVGLRSVQITPITYRLVCTNGMRAWRSEASVRMRHVGDPKRLHEQLRDAIPVAFAEARGDLARWRKATEVLIDSALDEIEGLRAFGLGQSEVQTIGRELASSQGLLSASSSAESVARALASSTTAFDVANAITAVARDRSDVATRLSMEEVGHRYLTRRAA